MMHVCQFLGLYSLQHIQKFLLFFKGKGNDCVRFMVLSFINIYIIKETMLLPFSYNDVCAP
jgi:hypothetical protein